MIFIFVARYTFSLFGLNMYIVVVLKRFYSLTTAFLILVGAIQTEYHHHEKKCCDNSCQTSNSDKEDHKTDDNDKSKCSICWFIAHKINSTEVVVLVQYFHFSYQTDLDSFSHAHHALFSLSQIRAPPIA
jgi:hypothetical protein